MEFRRVLCRSPATRPAAIPDAGPVADIARPVRLCRRQRLGRRYFGGGFRPGAGGVASGAPGHAGIGIGDDERGLSRRLSRTRSEEHTSELQSLMRISYAVFCLKKKKNVKHTLVYHH